MDRTVDLYTDKRRVNYDKIHTWMKLSRYKRILDILKWIEDYLQQKRIITISPKNFAKIDYYESEEVEDEI